MASNLINITNNDYKKINLLFEQTLKGKLGRLYYRLAYSLQHPHKKLFLSLIPSKLIPSHSKVKTSNLIYELDALWLIGNFKKPASVLTNYYYNLKYKTYYDLKKAHYQKFIISLMEIQAIIIKDQYCAREFLKSKSVVLDCGSNIGIFSLWAHRLQPSTQIYSFEPTLNTFEILKKNIKTNKIQKFIHPFNLALGNKIKNASMLISENNLLGGNTISNSNFANNNLLKYEEKQPIHMTTIDNFVKVKCLKKVDFIKIDTEGYEKQIITGAKKTIKKFHPVIACSAYHLPKDKKEIPKLVLKIEPKYKYRLEKRYEEVFIFGVKYNIFS